MLLQSTSSSLPSWRRKSLKISLWRKQSTSSSSSPSSSNLKLSITLHRHISDAHSLAILGVLLRRGTLAIPLSPAEWSKSNDVILVDAVMISFLTSPSSISLETPSGPIQLIMRTASRSAKLPATFNSHFFSLDLSRCLPREVWNWKKIAQVNRKDLVGFWQRCHP